MASKASLLLSFLLFSTCLAHHQQQQQLPAQNQCQIGKIDALEVCQRTEAEAGVTEFWNPDEQQLQCAGVEFLRHRIKPGGLLLPSYVNTPLLAFIEKGKAVHGVILPGCPETYESSQEQQFSGQSERRGQRFQGLQDLHQKVENLKQGDVVAIPAGAAHWLYNDGDTELIAVGFFDAQNRANQLDQYHRRFFLAGNPQAQSQEQQGQRQQEQPYFKSGNIFNGFDVEFLVEAFNVDQETAEKLQGQRDQRGHIVNVEQGLQIIRPPQTRQQQEQEQQGRRSQGGFSNSLEETICSLKLIENIDSPTHTDFVNPEAGRIANLNSFKFPILRQLQLSAERGELRPNAIQAPRWTLNAHTLVYVTDGSMRIQIVNNAGDSVFDDELREGQVVVIPQNFPVIKRAGEQGAKWISFKTNDNAMIANLAGRVSAIRSMPVDVVANSYQLSRNDAQRLKFSQQESLLLSPTSSRSKGKASAVPLNEGTKKRLEVCPTEDTILMLNGSDLLLFNFYDWNGCLRFEVLLCSFSYQCCAVCISDLLSFFVPLIEFWRMEEIWV